MYSHHSKNGSSMASVPKVHTKNAVLLEVEGWQLRRSRFPEPLGVGSYPVHMKCDAVDGGRGGGVMRNRDGTLSGACYTCDARVPDAIIGAWTLHNWDTATA